MCIQRLFSSCTHPRPTSRPHRRGSIGWRGALLFLITTWGGAASAELVIASEPIFLVSGEDPNLILTIDNSDSMDQAFLPEGIWGPDGGADPQLDARDLASFTNRQYYDPAQTYLPPLNSAGGPLQPPHASFKAAFLDAFHDTQCIINLEKKDYAPIWRLDDDSACTDRSATTADKIKSVYTVDVSHPHYNEFLKKTGLDNTNPGDKIKIGRLWALRCMDPAEGQDCDAVYYRFKSTTYKVPGDNEDTPHNCKELNPQEIKPIDFPPDCLERVIVGTPEDYQWINKLTWDAEKKEVKVENDAVTIRAIRDKLLSDESISAGDAEGLAKRNFANWFSYYRTRYLALKTVLTRVFDDLPTTTRFGYQSLEFSGYLNTTLGFEELANTFKPYSDNRKAFFDDWLIPQRASVGDTQLVSAAARAHEFCRSDQAYVKNPDQSIDPVDNPLRGCRNNFHVMFSDGYWTDKIGTPTTPLRFNPPASAQGSSLWLGNNDATERPLPENSKSVAESGLASHNYEPGEGYARFFADQNIGMLADVVFTSWITDLRPDEPAAEHRVPTRIKPEDINDTPEDIFWNPRNDPADWQHIRTFMIGLGVAGNVGYDPTLELPDGRWTYEAPGGTKTSGTLKEDGFPGDWNAIGGTSGDPLSGKIPIAVRIDDGWHAGINGRGGYLSAGDTTALAAAFKTVLHAVSTQAQESSAAAAAVNTGMTASQDIVYQARLNSEKWSGDVRSYQVSAGKGKEPCPTLNILAGQLCQDPSKGQYYQSAAQAMRKLLPDDRRIVTAANDTGTPFTWDKLTISQKLDFLTDDFKGTNPALATTDEIAIAELRLAYVKGDRTYEGVESGFRERATLSPCSESPCTNLLGDFINAAPVLVGAPAYYYNATGYQSPDGGFKLAHKDRTPLVYAGANDGMLHAFDAETLQEAFAFVPPVLSEPYGKTRLSALSKKDYQHQNFVDGPIVTGDVRFGTAEQAEWHTVLIGALGLGAQGLYSLDVTNVPAPTAGVDTFADKLYHWQFIDRDQTAAIGTTDKGAAASTKVIKGDPDLGYIFGRPAIVRVRGALVGRTDPTWVAIIGNGYNSTENDGSRNAGCDDATPDVDESDATACGQAVLYVIAIETGEVVKKFSTGVGRNDDPLAKRRSNALGQATVVATSVHTDGDLLADFAYATDLFGHVYRFDLTDTSTKEIRTIFSAVGSTIGTIAGSAQPITSPVAVARHPLGLGTLVLFGTGQYLTLADLSDQQVQTFYAIWDTGSDDQPPVARTALLRQTFEETNIIVKAGDDASAEEVSRGRTSTANQIDWATHLGWYIDFDIEKETSSNLNKGERVVTEPEVQGGRVIFVSLVPENNRCAGGGYSWINSLDVRNGSHLGLTPFDFNLDGSIGEADVLATTDGTQVVGTSVRLTPGGQSTGIYSSPSSFGDGAGRVTTVVSTSEGDLALINASDIQAWRVWQQLR